MARKKVYVQKKAEDLKIDDQFCHWAVMKDGLYPEPRRIQSIHLFKNKMLIYLRTEEKEEIKELLYKMIVVVQEKA